jgi:hypothetical protein
VHEKKRSEYLVKGALETEKNTHTGQELLKPYEHASRTEERECERFGSA